MARSGRPSGGEGGHLSLVRRDALCERLDRATRIVYVVAPAGSGKTMLVRAWLAGGAHADRTVWVTVDRGQDPAHLWFTLAAALHGVDPDTAESGSITPAPDLDPAVVLDRVSALLGGATPPLRIVLDDVHELERSEGLAQLERLVAHAPPHVQFVLITRQDLRIGLHRARLAGEVTEVRAADLRFTAEEASALFESAGVPLPEAVVKRLVERTEGWAAGLRLAALSLDGSQDPDEFADGFSGTDRAVSEYLFEEVLTRQPDAVKRLLLRTSILGRVSGPLADHLTGGADGQRILDELEDAGAFVTSLDSQRTWFRYHQLLADMLVRELRSCEPSEEQALHRRAAAWLAAHGDHVAAVRHAQAGADWATAASLLTDRWLDLYLDGDGVTAHGLLAGFPPGLLTADPQLAVLAAGDALDRESLAEAHRYAAVAARSIGEVQPDRRATASLLLATVQTGLAHAEHDLDAVREAARGVLEQTAGGDVDGVDIGFLGEVRALTLQNLGIAEVWAGRFPEAERHLEDAIVIARRARRPVVEVSAMSYAALLVGTRDLALARELGMRAVELAAGNGWDDEPFVGTAYTLLGTIDLWEGDLAGADEWLGRAARTLHQASQPAVGAILNVNLALLEVARGRREVSLSAVVAGERLAGGLPTMHRIATGVQAQMLLTLVLLGELERADRFLAGMDEPVASSSPAVVATAALRMARGDAPGAVDLVEPLCDDLDRFGGDRRWMIQALLLLASARDALRDAGGSRRALEAALDLAEAAGTMLPFLLLARPDLVERHAQLGTAHASLVADVLTTLSGKPTAGADAEPLARPLSDTELRVLRYLPTNLPAPEIADHLSVSVNTVRTHMHHIYAKLEVHSRTDAVTRARALGLLAHRSAAR